MSILRQAYLSFPQFRTQFLRVEQVALKANAFKQLSSLEADDEPLYKDFTELLRRAVDDGTPVLPVVKMDDV